MPTKPNTPALPTPPAAPKKPRPIAADSGIRSVYGFDITVDQARSREFMFALELKCYRENVTKELGGLGAEQHFKNAWHLIWPEYEWSDWVEMLVHAWCNFKYISVIGHRRASKCLRKGTEVLLYDGTVIPVEDVKVGMLLMGDDSTPRKVLSLASGREMMYSIKSSRGGEWGCNESHILSFKCSRDRKHRMGHITHKAGEVIDVPLTDFLKKGTNWRSTWKQYQVGVDFPDTGFVPPVDPYIYGAWLADGGFDTPSFCKPRGPMTERWVNYWESKGARIVVEDEERCPQFFVRYNDKNNVGGKKNFLTEFIRTCTVTGEKRVRRDYLTGSFQQRAALLAGLLDGDGCSQGNKFTITTKYPGLAKDILFLARSLGLYASDKRRIGRIKSIGFVGEYRSVYISGDWSKIPTIQKFATGKRSNEPLCQSITATPTGEGEYFGFELDGNRRFLLGDFTVTHNTWTSSHIAWLDYCANPFNTLTNLTTVTFEGLKLRMWADMMFACESAKMKQPFRIRNSTNEMRVYPEEVAGKSGEKHQIHGMAIDRSKDAAGRIKGAHADRVRIFIDEAENMPAVIYDSMDNPMSAPDTPENHLAAKCVMLFNPVEKLSPASKLCEPEAGWASVTDTDLFWLTKKDRGVCLHFDGLQSPNLVQNKKVFNGLLTPQDVEEVRKDPLAGEDSVKWWSQIRGWFPPDGMVSRIFPSQLIEKAKPDIIFDFPTTPVASLDPAFGGDNCVIIWGDKGKLRDGRMAINTTGSEVIKFKVSDSADIIDHQIKDFVIQRCKARGVAPANFIMDRSGGGRGVFAMLHKEWSAEVQGIDYGGAATDRPLRSDEEDKCSDVYEKFVTELWFRCRETISDGLLGGLARLDQLTADDLFSRRFETKEVTRGTVTVAESKKELKKRLGRSCDFGDAFCQMAELLIREGHGPGRLKPQAGTSTRWQRQRSRAIQASKRYSEKNEFAH